MGDFMKENDIYVESLLNQLSLRFAPPTGHPDHYGGLEEMVALQKEFKIFKRGRSFKTSAAVLNIGGGSNNAARNRLQEYFGNLSQHASNVTGQNGDEAIVNALIKNLAADKPLPVLFTYHDMRAEKGNTRVLINRKERAISYFPHEYLVISFPTREATASRKAVAASKSKRGKKA